MSKSLNNPRNYINRELSWLEFNDRVLQEGLSESVPLLERLKFLAIVSSNLDEFFMIRVAGLGQARAAGVRKKDCAGLTPAGQIKRILARASQMVADQSAAIEGALAELRDHEVFLLKPTEWTDEQRRFLREYFASDIEPTLTPVAMDQMNPKPLLPGLRLHVALELKAEPPAPAELPLAVIPIPGMLPRFIQIPAEQGLHLARLEDVILTHAAGLLPGQEIRNACVFRLTRDGDVNVEFEEDDSGDLLEHIAEAIRQRTRRRVVRLEISAGTATSLKRGLQKLVNIDNAGTFEIETLLDAKALFSIAEREGLEHLRYEPWKPQPPADLLGSEDLFETLQDRDVMLFHPYESFDPVVELVDRAADDPRVLAIKQTLYRTTGDSPIVAALMRAAQVGKQVTVLVELKARFDEQRNVRWALALEEAGADVIYGIAGLKTHAKMLLIVRREEYGIRRYLHLSTGNYNDKTVRLYSDIGIMTTDRELTVDIAAFSNLLTGYSQPVGWKKLVIAPTDLRQHIEDLIDREARLSTKHQPGEIMAKINSLQCPRICAALYRASQAGVKIKLNVRGVCCLRPGVKGISENIEVTSIIDRYLEHARIFYFRNGGHEEYYLSSADWMVRNLDKRLETFFPILAEPLKKRTRAILDTFFADNVKSWRLDSDGTYHRVEQAGPAVRAQEVFYQQAKEAAAESREGQLQFHPRRKNRTRKKG
jgi:polyphosphate kinase